MPSPDARPRTEKGLPIGNTTAHAFRISTRLKDLIGRELITNQYAAVFELVKNSFDAHAKAVRLTFESDRIVITDDGKGMSHDAILQKWLFVGYSAKHDNTEDADYSGPVASGRPNFAGDKGVGRFSCDRLGSQLRLCSRAEGQPVQVLHVDWTRYEEDMTEDFVSVQVDLQQRQDFPQSPPISPRSTGTVLEITKLRTGWDRAALIALKRGLAKLINPFDPDPARFRIRIVAPREVAADKEAERKGNTHDTVNGRIENNILQVIGQRTTQIRVRTVDGGKTLETTLTDRGRTVYSVREHNTYERLARSSVGVEIYYLNRKAKTVFTRRMGLRSVDFGSIFLFRNGFRVFPIGEENDDFFGLARRKQQGVKRYLGTRDLIGRVEVTASTGFAEATSRDQGLIRTPEVTELIRFIIEKGVRRLERYVVDITWKDKLDKDVDDTSRVMLDPSSAEITRLVSGLAATKGLEVLSYDRDLVRLVDERSTFFRDTLEALAILAEKTGDPLLLQHVEDAKVKLEVLHQEADTAREREQRAEEKARAAEKRAEEAERRATSAEESYQSERKRNAFLVAVGSLEEDTILNLHHQIGMYASDVSVGIRTMMRKLRRGVVVDAADWTTFLDVTAFRVRQILTAARFATKRDYKEKAATITADLPVYIQDYVATIVPLWKSKGLLVVTPPFEGRFVTEFRPIDVGIVVDNLVSNAQKARATRLMLNLELDRGPKPDLWVTAADNGDGWNPQIEPLSRVFEKGVTTTDGSGLGLYHVSKVVEDLRGVCRAHREPFSEQYKGAHLTLIVPS